MRNSDQISPAGENAYLQLSPPMVEYEYSSCPLCSDPQGEPILEELCDSTRIEIVVCRGCGFGYSNPRPTEIYKLRRYGQWTAGDRPWDAEAHYDHRQQLRHFGLYRRVMRVIETRLDHGRLLDVGCAGGLFLVFAGVFASDHNSGLNSRFIVEGAGFDPREVELARQISGAPVMTIAELTHARDDAFDAITLLNTLEHANRPTELLRELRRLLRPGGVLVIVVPNNELAFWKLRRHVGRRPMSLASNEHINHFRPATLNTMLIRSGFRNVKFLPGSHEGGCGSIAKVTASQLAKYTAYRLVHILKLGYVYPEIFVVAN